MFLVFLAVVSWWDLKIRAVPLWIYVVFGVVGLAENLYAGNRSVTELLFSFLPGIFLLVLTKVTGGCIGSGDGCFFLTAAFYQNFFRISALLFYGMLFCSMCSLGIIVCGIWSNLNVRKKDFLFFRF